MWSGSLRRGDSRAPFQIAIWRCPDRPVTLAVSHIGDEAEGIDRFGRVRCAPLVPGAAAR
jgi:hypothetical protein